ncbi:YqzE family protein [Virgibacillus halodenitrificans]|nr:YqzE family protein [Virgibacillus halodenitrificans]
MSRNDYLKFMTEQIVSYIDLPPEERKKKHNEKKSNKIVANRWFGILPFAYRTWRKKG